MTRPLSGSSSFPVVLAGPSGGGKTTVGRALEARRSDVRFAVSATTRKRRHDETDGRDYRFLSRDEFEDLIEHGKLLEWATVHGELYGTPLSDLSAAREDGVHLLLDIDVQGMRALRSHQPDSVTIFFMPPDAQSVVQRLKGRNSEDAESLRRRLETALSELAAIGEFDYIVVNETVADAVDQVEAILDAESARVGRSSEAARARAQQLSHDVRALLET
ncbi:MAG: guanylate kinase [Gemmatimonadota bacterium]